jgi:hypothetical protein
MDWYPCSVCGDGAPVAIGGEGVSERGDRWRGAARHINEIDLDDRVVVWGHSQGGHAALWSWHPRKGVCAAYT